LWGKGDAVTSEVVECALTLCCKPNCKRDADNVLAQDGIVRAIEAMCHERNRTR
jgi:hypothetical protein